MLLQKFESLFDGTLGTWDTEPIDLELKDPEAKPYHARPYPVPPSQEAKLKAEIERLVSYGVLRKVNRSEWGSPMFTVAKKDQTLRSIAGLREVNATAFPLSYAFLGKAQSTDIAILKETAKTKSLYSIQPFTGGGKTRELICCDGKIVVPKKL
jgi:hypothetical protein